MAPEQAAGRGKDVGPAADVYSLGAILYELLTGSTRPSGGATPVETLLQVKLGDPVPLSRLQPGVPRDLETICLKCLHKDRLKRYDSAEELADDLRRYLDGKPVVAPGRSRRAWQRRPQVGGAATAGRWPPLLAVSAAVLLVGFPLVSWQWYQTRRAWQAPSRPNSS